jgi:D-alanyl-lipoteichoic acid acyltransferase DltB (MBOAT superfamily)
MLFHSAEFVFVFLPASLIVFFFLASRSQRRGANAWLLFMSLVFYGFGAAAHVALIAGSVIANYWLGLFIRDCRAEARFATARAAMACGVGANLGLLGFFKYAGFATANVNALLATQWSAPTILLPLAISFFTLQQIAYLVDVSRGRAEETNFVDYALFVTFYPQLIAGPIVHHGEILPQFRGEAPYRFQREAFFSGLSIFFLGLFKKVALADPLGTQADPVFQAAAAGTPPTFYAAWTGVLAFGFQIYFDFSAYSDMAIGLARMLCIRLPINFDSPYQATSIIEFWRRWHVTLSRFLRDYLYFPLGGNRRGEVRRYVNLMATMVIGGVWHGASWTFVVWGGLHGFYLVINHLWRTATGRRDGGRTWMGRLAGTTLTFAGVTVAWVFFRAESFAAARLVLEGMAGIHGALLPAQLVELVPALELIANSSGYVPLLGGGTVLGFAELVGLLAVSSTVVFCGANLQRMSERGRLILLVFTSAFTLRELVFGHGASTFIYFRF